MNLRFAAQTKGGPGANDAAAHREAERFYRFAVYRATADCSCSIMLSFRGGNRGYSRRDGVN